MANKIEKQIARDKKLEEILEKLDALTALIQERLPKKKGKKSE